MSHTGREQRSSSSGRLSGMMSILRRGQGQDPDAKFQQSLENFRKMDIALNQLIADAVKYLESCRHMCQSQDQLADTVLHLTGPDEHLGADSCKYREAVHAMSAGATKRSVIGQLQEQIETMVLEPLSIHLQANDDIKGRIEKRKSLAAHVASLHKGGGSDSGDSKEKEAKGKFEQYSSKLCEDMDAMHECRFAIIAGPYRALKSCQFKFHLSCAGLLQSVVTDQESSQATLESLRRRTPLMAHGLGDTARYSRSPGGVSQSSSAPVTPRRLQSSPTDSTSEHGNRENGLQNSGIAVEMKKMELSDSEVKSETDSAGGVSAEVVPAASDAVRMSPVQMKRVDSPASSPVGGGKDGFSGGESSFQGHMSSNGGAAVSSPGVDNERRAGPKGKDGYMKGKADGSLDQVVDQSAPNQKKAKWPQIGRHGKTKPWGHFHELGTSPGDSDSVSNVLDDEDFEDDDNTSFVFDNKFLKPAGLKGLEEI